MKAQKAKYDSASESLLSQMNIEGEWNQAEIKRESVELPRIEKVGKHTISKARN